jgi:hemerythrin
MILLPAASGRIIRMSFMTWNDKFSVGAKTIDQQHARLFAIVNELHTAMTYGHAKNAVGSLLERLIKHTIEHFACEEHMLQAVNYPGLGTQRAHHANLTHQVAEFMARYKRSDDAVNIGLLQFLSDWLTRHIQREDKRYSPFLTCRAT